MPPAGSAGAVQVRCSPVDEVGQVDVRGRVEQGAGDDVVAVADVAGDPVRLHGHQRRARSPRDSASTTGSGSAASYVVPAATCACPCTSSVQAASSSGVIVETAAGHDGPTVMSIRTSRFAAAGQRGLDAGHPRRGAPPVGGHVDVDATGAEAVGHVGDLEVRRSPRRRPGRPHARSRRGRRGRAATTSGSRQRWPSRACGRAFVQVLGESRPVAAAKAAPGAATVPAAPTTAAVPRVAAAAPKRERRVRRAPEMGSVMVGPSERGGRRVVGSGAAGSRGASGDSKRRTGRGCGGPGHASSARSARSAPGARPCTSTLPSAVASTGPASTGSPQRSAVSWQSSSF